MRETILCVEQSHIRLPCPLGDVAPANWFLWILLIKRGDYTLRRNSSPHCINTSIIPRVTIRGTNENSLHSDTAYDRAPTPLIKPPSRVKVLVSFSISSISQAALILRYPLKGNKTSFVVQHCTGTNFPSSHKATTFPSTGLFSPSLTVDIPILCANLHLTKRANLKLYRVQTNMLDCGSNHGWIADNSAPLSGVNWVLVRRQALIGMYVILESWMLFWSQGFNMQEEIAVELDWKVQWIRQAMDEVWMFHFLASLMISASCGYILTPLLHICPFVSM